MYSLKDEYEAMFLNSPEKVRAKKKLNELFDKYGENRQDIENGTNNVEYMEYVMASAFADEVLAERRRKRKEQNTQNDDWDEYNPYAPTDVEEEEEEEEIAAEDMPISEQVKKVTEDKELQSKSGQMAVEAYKNLDKEKIRKDTEKYVKQTDKEQADLMNELIKKFKIDMEKYGDGFSKEYIRVMLRDDDFQKAVVKVLGNEGGYVNDKDDKGGETKYGISRKAYPNENIKDLTKERAKMLYYKDYWYRFDFEGLSDSVAGMVFDNAVNQGVYQAKKNMLNALNLADDMKISDIDWDIVKAKIKELGDVKFKSLLTKKIIGVYNTLIKKNSSQKKYEKGWKNRVKRY